MQSIEVNAYRIIAKTRLAWLLPSSESPSTQDGKGEGVEGVCQPESSGFGQGRIGVVARDLRGCEARTRRFGRWAGQGLGVRAPMDGETPLSRAEVEHGIEHDLIDALPTRRIIKPVGAWELSNVQLLAKAQPFDGLMA